MQIESSAKAVAKLTDMDYESASENDIESDADAPLLLDKIPLKALWDNVCMCVCPIPSISQEWLEAATFCHYVMIALAFLWLSSWIFSLTKSSKKDTHRHQVSKKSCHFISG